jgi:hypothetical protein
MNGNRNLSSIALVLGYKHPIFEWPIEGPIVGCSHWQKIEVQELLKNIDRVTTRQGLLDTSTKAIYRRGYDNDRPDLVTKCFLATLALPFHFVGSVLYNCVRLVVVVAYFIFQTFNAFYSQSAEGPDRKSFKAIFIDQMKLMGIELLRSIVNIVRAPYYALGVFFGLLYGLVDPWNGRKVVEAFESAWNHHIPLNESYWMCKKMEHYQWKMVGENALYITGCFKRVRYYKDGAIYKNEEIRPSHSIKLEPARCCGLN